jgi:hypothetical protein
LWRGAKMISTELLNLVERCDQPDTGRQWAGQVVLPQCVIQSGHGLQFSVLTAFYGLLGFLQMHPQLHWISIF